METIAIEQNLNTLFQEPVKHLTPLHGGQMAKVYAIELASKQKFVVKIGNKLELEAQMLKYLKKHTSLPVPEVIHNEGKLLVMNFLEGSSCFTKVSERHAAELLAELHSIKAKQYGFEKDTLIGNLHQPNKQSSSWIDFFCEQRLLYISKVAFEAQRLPLKFLKQIEALANHLEDYLEEAPYPSLIHGDLWPGNILSDGRNITGIIDPAIYYADAEMELAFISLFNTFGEGFFVHYRELRGARTDFEIRKNIYNLYPLLVHVYFFGGHYVSSVENILKGNSLKVG